MTTNQDEQQIRAVIEAWARATYAHRRHPSLCCSVKYAN